MRIDSTSLVGQAGRFDGFVKKPGSTAAAGQGPAPGDAPAAASSPAQAFSGNPMSGNFVHVGSHVSRYARGRRAAMQASFAMQSRQSAVLQAGMTALAGITASPGGRENYAELALAGQKAARGMRREQTQSVAERSEENLDDLKDDVEARAEKAAAPAGGAGERASGQTTGETAAGTSGKAQAGAEQAVSPDGAGTGAEASPASAASFTADFRDADSPAAAFLQMGSPPAPAAPRRSASDPAFAPVDIFV